MGQNELEAQILTDTQIQHHIYRNLWDEFWNTDIPSLGPF